MTTRKVLLLLSFIMLASTMTTQGPGHGLRTEPLPARAGTPCLSSCKDPSSQTCISCCTTVRHEHDWMCGTEQAHECCTSWSPECWDRSMPQNNNHACNQCGGGGSSATCEDDLNPISEGIHLFVAKPTASGLPCFDENNTIWFYLPGSGNVTVDTCSSGISVDTSVAFLDSMVPYVDGDCNATLSCTPLVDDDTCNKNHERVSYTFTNTIGTNHIVVRSSDPARLVAVRISSWSCGNGNLADGGLEECDDGNSIEGDGCTAACKLEPYHFMNLQTGNVERCQNFSSSECLENDPSRACVSVDGGAYTSACLTPAPGYTVHHGMPIFLNQSVTGVKKSCLTALPIPAEVVDGGQLEDFDVSDGMFDHCHSWNPGNWFTFVGTGAGPVRIITCNYDTCYPALNQCEADVAFDTGVMVLTDGCEQSNCMENDVDDDTCLGNEDTTVENYRGVKYTIAVFERSTNLPRKKILVKFVFPPLCGGGVRQENEECDDGNNDDGDGCSSTCTVEDGFACPLTGGNCTRCAEQVGCAVSDNATCVDALRVCLAADVGFVVNAEGVVEDATSDVLAFFSSATGYVGSTYTLSLRASASASVECGVAMDGETCTCADDIAFPASVVATTVGVYTACCDNGIGGGCREQWSTLTVVAPPVPNCTDGVQNGNETGVDCGGDCDACPSCSDGVMNGGETNVDCGGECSPCSNTVGAANTGGSGEAEDDDDGSSSGGKVSAEAAAGLSVGMLVLGALVGGACMFALRPRSSDDADENGKSFDESED